MDIILMEKVLRAQQEAGPLLVWMRLIPARVNRLPANARAQGPACTPHGWLTWPCLRHFTVCHVEFIVTFPMFFFDGKKQAVVSSSISFLGLSRIATCRPHQYFDLKKIKIPWAQPGARRGAVVGDRNRAQRANVFPI